MDKSALLAAVKEIVSQKISSFQKLIQETRAANTETKSSMGDKYETGREMLQQEINNLQIQHNQNSKSLQILNSIQPNPHKVIGLGSIVNTETATYFITISFGEISIEDSKIFVISLESPIAKAMLGKTEKDTFTFNNSEQKILKIW